MSCDLKECYLNVTFDSFENNTQEVILNSQDIRKRFGLNCNQQAIPLLILSEKILFH